MPDTAPPADGAAITSSYLQTMLREQVIRTVTSSTRPTGVEGCRIYETDTDRELLYDGTGWIVMSEPTQSYTPTFANTTLGNGTAAGTSKRSDGWVDWTAKFTLGSSSAVGTGPTVTLPYASVATPAQAYAPNVAFLDGSNLYAGTLYYTSTTVCTLYTQSAAGSYVTFATTTATIPFTWATGDVIFAWGRYQMTTRYT